MESSNVDLKIAHEFLEQHIRICPECSMNFTKIRTHAKQKI